MGDKALYNSHLDMSGKASAYTVTMATRPQTPIIMEQVETKHFNVTERFDYTAVAKFTFE